MLGPADDESQLGRDHRARDRVLVACEDRSWGRHLDMNIIRRLIGLQSWKYLSFTNYSLRSGIPVPQEHLEIKDCMIRKNGAFLC